LEFFDSVSSARGLEDSLKSIYSGLKYDGFKEEIKPKSFFSVGLEIFEAIRILIEKGPCGINRRENGFVPNVEEKRIEARLDGHGKKGSIDQSPPGEPHAHLTNATDNVGIGEARLNCFDRLQSDEDCIGFNRYRKDKISKQMWPAGKVMWLGRSFGSFR
jgi:hypothetical protein